MTRSFVTSDEMVGVSAQLKKLVLLVGSVNKVCSLLNLANEHSGHKRLYPNRLHAILSDKQYQAVNSGTADAVMEALSNIIF